MLGPDPSGDGPADSAGDGAQHDLMVARKDTIHDGVPTDRKLLDLVPPDEVSADTSGVDGIYPDGPGGDLMPPDSLMPDACSCVPKTTLSCGPCGLGTQECQCTGYESCVVPGTTCTPGTTQSCGPCLTGTETCQSDCTWGFCNGMGCTPGSVTGCPNNCGQRTCQSSCTWSACSKSGQAVSAPYLCWSANYCGDMGFGKCLPCSQICDAAGTLAPDAWCTICDSCAGHVDGC